MGIVRLTAVAVVFLSMAGPAVAAGKADKVRALLEATNASSMAAQMAQAVNAQMLPALQRSNPSMPPAAWAVLAQELDQAFTQSAPAMVEAMVPIYERHFTEGEIDDLTAFYRTPTGRKSLATMPALMQEGMAVGQRMAPQIAEKAMQKAMIRIKEMGYTR